MDIERILIVDDEEVNRTILEVMFRSSFHIVEATNGQEAIDRLEEDPGFVLVLLDIVMPIKDGFDVLEYMKQKGLIEQVPVILITSETIRDSEDRAYAYGIADVIHKPFYPDIVKRRAQNIIDLYQHQANMERKLKEQEEAILAKEKKIQENNEFLISALSSVVEFRSSETGEHIRRIKYFTRILLKYLAKYFPKYGITETQISEIAREIASRQGVKFIMIAGPSSSGKTSLSHRLSIQLRTLGMTPHPVALDNYFVNREDTPLDENGDYNFECLEAIDVKRFNDDMIKLLNGERVEIPEFNFKVGRREYNGNYMQLGKEDVLVIEGIHGLNPKMSYALPEESKYKIYISALINLNVDAHNRIPTTDGRLLRRLVRDARTRGASAQRTIQMWPSVRRGEEEYIFPFQEEADVMFNSATIYELAALKQYAEPLLFHIEKNQPEYYEAKRLLKFLEYFLGISSEELPKNSICREFVGGSCFRV